MILKTGGFSQGYFEPYGVGLPRGGPLLRFFTGDIAAKTVIACFTGMGGFPFLPYFVDALGTAETTVGLVFFDKFQGIFFI
jgi:hypothetical protein